MRRSAQLERDRNANPRRVDDPTYPAPIQMLALEDPKWKTLNGGYRTSYDVSTALQTLKTSTDPKLVWEELWNELHHQGDVGEASYAAVPHLVRIVKDRGFVDWNLYSLVSTIEIERHAKQNPPLPDWAKASYEQAWKELLDLATKDLHMTDDELTVRTILGAMAVGKGMLKLGRILTYLDAHEIEDIHQQF